jgi:APA family basic amino acid/polyamine antiporter
MARDGLFFPSLARLHHRYRTPAAAILFQGAWAIGLTITGRYGDLLDYVVFGDWIFFAAVASTVFVFRSRERTGRESSRPRFRMPGYPYLPVAFILAAIYVVGGSVASNPSNAVKGTVLILLGIPVFLFWDRREKRKHMRINKRG